jgi:hypothetical protein
VEEEFGRLLGRDFLPRGARQKRRASQPALAGRGIDGAEQALVEGHVRADRSSLVDDDADQNGSVARYDVDAFRGQIFIERAWFRGGQTFACLASYPF